MHADPEILEKFINTTDEYIGRQRDISEGNDKGIYALNLLDETAWCNLNIRLICTATFVALEQVLSDKDDHTIEEAEKLRIKDLERHAEKNLEGLDCVQLLTQLRDTLRTAILLKFFDLKTVAPPVHPQDDQPEEPTLTLREQWAKQQRVRPTPTRIGVDHPTLGRITFCY